jgi:tRNA (guanine37-N1)-methyltransferase
LRIKVPKGRKYDQSVAQEFAKLDHLVIIAGHYEEVDARIEKYIDEEVSLGDFVMTGGEITAAAIVDSVVRLLPGVLKKEEATQIESFFEVDSKKLSELLPENELITNLTKRGVEKVKLLEYPQYTRPEEFKGEKVPAILLSGHEKRIDEWRIRMAFEETLKKRPDLLK